MPVPNLNDPLDIQRPAIEILMEQINVENNTELLASDFLFSAPSPATLVYSDVNTQLTLTPKVTSGYFGSRTIYYKRMDINQILSNEQVEILITTETLLSEIIPQINTKYGINLTTDDYIDNALPVVNPAAPDAPLAVVVAIKPTSYLFTGTCNLVLGHKVFDTDETGIHRNYYVVTDVGADAVYTNKLFAFDSTFTPSQAFNVLRNALNITKFRIDNVIVLGTTDICLIGEFGFDAAIGTDPLQTHDVKTVFISNTGNIKSVSTNAMFGGVGITNQIANRNVNKVYLLDKSDVIGLNASRVYRFNLDGVLEGSYNPPGLTYVPSLIRVDDVGRLYTVSPEMNTTSPVSFSTAHKHIRIDRFTALGAIDPTFNTVVITSTGTADVTPVIDVKPFQQLGAWVLLKPIHTTGTNSDTPLVNLLPLVPGSTATDGSFNPLFRINNDGSYYQNFKPLLLNNEPSSVFIDDVSVVADSYSISGGNTAAAYITNRVNPVTGYTHKAPITYKANGTQVRSINNLLVDEIKWLTIKEVIPLTNGNFIVNGNGKVKLTNGGWSNALDRAVLFNKDSQVIRTIYTALSSSVVTIQHLKVNEIAST